MKSGKSFLKDYFLKHRGLSERDLDDLVTKSSMSYEQVRDWFSQTAGRVEEGREPFSDEEEDGEEDEEEEEEEEDSAALSGRLTSSRMGNVSAAEGSRMFVSLLAEGSSIRYDSSMQVRASSCRGAFRWSCSPH